jgi:phosphopantothenoylcysteine decarboxylase/phosphopantothenate--cysteine ligase
MLSAVNMASQNCDVFIACAAVADWAPANAATQKLKKDGSGAVPTLSFVENPDILASVASSPAALAGRLYCVGFAAESHDLLAHAQAKRVRKGVPMLVGNIGPDTFGQDDNALVLITEQAPVATERADKLSLAHWLLSHIAPQLT